MLQAVPGYRGHLEFLCRDCFSHYNMTRDNDKGNTDDDQTAFNTKCKISDSGTKQEYAHYADTKTHEVDEPLSMNESHL